MPIINPMTGQLYSTAMGAMGTGTPIGLTALQQNAGPGSTLDKIMGGGAFSIAAGYRGRSSLLTNGGYQSPFMQKVSFKKYFDASNEASKGKAGPVAIARDFGREQAMRFNPSTWVKAPSFGTFDPSVGRFENAPPNMIVKRLHLDRFDWVKNHWIGDDGAVKHIWDPHLFSRLGAASTWDKRALDAGGNRALTDTETGAMRDYLEQANKPLFDTLKNSGGFEDLTAQDAGAIVRMGMNKSITGRVGGFVQGMLNPDYTPPDAMMRTPTGSYDVTPTGPMMEDTAASVGWRSGEAYGQLGNIRRNEGWGGVSDRAGMSVDDLVAKGMSRNAAERLAGKGATELMLRAGLEVGGSALAQFIPGIDVAVDAYMAYTAAKYAAHVANKYIVTPGIHAFQNFEGQIHNSPFGMGYHDTLAASTSRSRGVAAIQNSRLNARSVLGNEASSIYQHFA